jgi:diadenosine tetraphosphate (Ap4A) HIT family hydrolase
MSDSAPNCVFCNPDPRDIIEETGHALALYSADAIKPGHLIIAVKEHVTFFEELSDAQAADLFALARRTAAAAQHAVGAEKYYTVSIADLVPHFHLHLLPRMSGDAPIGPYVMGDAGWRSVVGREVAVAARNELIAKLRARP